VGPMGFSETSARNYPSTLLNILEKWRSCMTIWRCRPWLASAWSGSEQSRLVLHTRI